MNLKVCKPAVIRKVKCSRMSWELNHETYRQMYKPSTSRFSNVLSSCLSLTFHVRNMFLWLFLCVKTSFLDIMLTSQNFSGNRAPSQMFFAGQDEHVSFISHVRIFQVVRGVKQQPLSHDFTSLASRLLLPPHGALWNIYNKPTWNPQTVLLKYRDLHLCRVRVLCSFLLFTSSRWSSMYGILV